MASDVYPDSPAERTAWIQAHRPPRRTVHPRRAYASLREQEPRADGGLDEVLTVFLSNRECPWRCLMCDLWRNTLEQPVAAGDIPAQIDQALADLHDPSQPPPTVLKLYNAGSFFDPGAIPRVDWSAIAERAAGFSRVVVECHPALVGAPCREFADLLEKAAHEKGYGTPRLEVAMGLETAQPAVLERLNKRMTLELFAQAARDVADSGLDLRAFVLVQPPFLPVAESVDWAVRSAEFAFARGARLVGLIPVRPGNGALDALVLSGQFRKPTLAQLEEAQERVLALRGGLVLADTWDLQIFSECGECRLDRQARLEAMNLSQRVLPRIACACSP